MQVPHRSATTTEAIRRAIQHSQKSLRALSKRYGSEEGQKTIPWGPLRKPLQAASGCGWAGRNIMIEQSSIMMAVANFFRFMALAVRRAWIFMFLRPRRIALASPCSGCHHDLPLNFHPAGTGARLVWADSTLVRGNSRGAGQSLGALTVHVLASLTDSVALRLCDRATEAFHSVSGTSG